MVKVREELANMQRSLRNQLGRLTTEIESVKLELQDVDTALAAIDGKIKSSNVAQVRTNNESSAPRTIKEMILEILALMPDGAEATELLSFIDERFGKKLERTSLSPQLSRLKKDGLISLSGKVWTINEEGSDESEPFRNVGAVDGSRELDSYPQPDGSIPSASTPISRDDGELPLSDIPDSNPEPAQERERSSA